MLNIIPTPKIMSSKIFEKPRGRQGGSRGGTRSDPRIAAHRLKLQSERLASQKRNAEMNWKFKSLNLLRNLRKDRVDAFNKLFKTVKQPQPVPAVGRRVNRATSVAKAADEHVAKMLETMRGSGLPTLFQGLGALKPTGGRRR